MCIFATVLWLDLCACSAARSYVYSSILTEVWYRNEFLGQNLIILNIMNPNTKCNSYKADDSMRFLLEDIQIFYWELTNCGNGIYKDSDLPFRSLMTFKNFDKIASWRHLSNAFWYMQNFSNIGYYYFVASHVNSLTSRKMSTWHRCCREKALKRKNSVPHYPCVRPSVTSWAEERGEHVVRRRCRAQFPNVPVASRNGTLEREAFRGLATNNCFMKI